MKAVDVTDLHIRPVPKELYEKVLCTNCKGQAARWELAEGANPAWSYSCSLCFLYEMPSMKVQRAEVDGLVVQVEEACGSTFPRNPEGRLALPNDGDRLAFGVVMSQRFTSLRNKHGGFNK